MKRALPTLALVIGCSRETARATADDARATEAPTHSASPRPRAPSSLAGRWRVRTSHRLLDAVATSEGDYEFVVADAAQWRHAYAKGDVRFRLVRAADGSFRVIDHYRPFLDGHSYTPSGRAACLRTETHVAGKPLRAEHARDDTLRVDFAEVVMVLEADRVDPSKIVGCREDIVRGRVTMTLDRAP